MTSPSQQADSVTDEGNDSQGQPVMVVQYKRPLCDVSRYKKKPAVRLGAIQIVIGIVCITCHIARLVVLKHRDYFLGNGTWEGIIVSLLFPNKRSL